MGGGSTTKDGSSKSGGGSSYASRVKRNFKAHVLKKLGRESISVYLKEIYEKLPMFETGVGELIVKGSEQLDKSLEADALAEDPVIFANIQKCANDWVQEKENLAQVPMDAMEHSPTTLISLGKLFLAIYDARVASELFWGATILALKNYADLIGVNRNLLTNNAMHLRFADELFYLHIVPKGVVNFTGNLDSAKILHTDGFYEGQLSVKQVKGRLAAVEEFVGHVANLPAEISDENRQNLIEALRK